MTDDLELHISADLVLPLDAVTETTAILGVRGTGKTNTAVVMAEEFLSNGQQIVVIDPTDVWWGLKSSKDGEHAGYPIVILGGRKADLPLAAGDGATIADFVVDHGASIICSLRRFESKSGMKRFVADFARRLYFRKGETEFATPLHVFIDEAALFVPQRVMGDDADMVGAIQQLVRQGRSSGFGVTLIDQRASSVNKDVLTQLELLVCHRTSAPQDRKALKEWVEQHDTDDRLEAFMKGLASLPRGEAWFWSSGWLEIFRRVSVRERVTFDSSRTPKAGERITAPKRFADVDLEALKQHLGATIEKARAEDPAVLKKRISELERAAERGTGRVSSGDAEMVASLKAELKDEYQRGYGDAEVQMRDQIERPFREAASQVREIWNRASQLMAALVGEMADPLGVLEGLSIETSAPIERPPVRPAVERKSAPSLPTVPRPSSSEGLTVGKGPQRMLNAALFLKSIGIDPAPRDLVGALSGINASTGTFRTYLSELRKAESIRDVDSATIAITPAGERRASSDDLPQTRRELHDVWLAKLGDTPRRMLRHLLDAYPSPVQRTALGDAIGVMADTGTFRTYLSEVRRLGAIEDVDKQTVRAAALLFPKGMRK